VVASAPTIGPRLLAALVRLDNPHRPIAETNRRLGMVADHLAVPRPSYEQVRVLIHDLRTCRLTVPPACDLLLDIAFRSRPPEAVLRDLIR
jgi:hypothetical protein